MPTDDPIAMFAALFERAGARSAEADAMVLSTVDADGRPSARYVLLKGVDASRIRVLHQPRESQGARAGAHPYAALTFYWPPETQVRIEGRCRACLRRRRRCVLRDAAARLADWRVGVEQSAELASRDVLDARSAIENRFASGPVTRPPFWTGFRVVPRSSSSGPAIPHGCMSACAFNATATIGRDRCSTRNA